MDYEIAFRLRRAEHETRVSYVNAHGWKLPPRLPGRVRLALARFLVAFAVRLVPTVTLPEPARPVVTAGSR